MISQDGLEKIKEIIKEFFQKTTFDAEVEISPVRGRSPEAIASSSAATSNGVKKSPLSSQVSGDKNWEDKESVLINLKMEDPQIFIGQGGETLQEIQHLLKTILYKKIKELVLIDLDINDYKKKKVEYLKELAKSSAEEVVLMKKEKILFPMPAYERRIMHMELSNHPNVTTESVGKEPERMVVIKPR